MRIIPALIALSLLAGCAPRAPDIAVSDVWARATAPGQSSAAIYANIANRGGDDRLVGVSSPAGMAMLHGNEASGGVARMRMKTDLASPAGTGATLAPGRGARPPYAAAPSGRSPLVAR